MWTTNGTQADWMCLLANTSEGAAHKNKSLICVPMKTKGVEIARKLDKLGMRSSDTAQIFFDDVRVPQRYPDRRGRQGLHLSDAAVPRGTAVGGRRQAESLERVIAQTIEYTRNRKAFGKSILDNQVVHFRLAELATEIELLRALVYRACELYLAGADVTRLASMAKLKAGRLQPRSQRCLPAILGRHGLHERDARSAATIATAASARSAAAPTKSC